MPPEISSPHINQAPGILRGALIACEDGALPIEAIKSGDIVNTLSDGPQVVRWVGIASHSKVAVNLRAGALGDNRPAQDLMVTPAQRMVISSWQSKVLFGESEVLVAAMALLTENEVALTQEQDDRTFFHILFDKHEIISANNAPSESFYPSKSALNTLPSEARAALLSQVPELSTMNPNQPFSLVRPVITAAEAALLR